MLQFSVMIHHYYYCITSLDVIVIESMEIKIIVWPWQDFDIFVRSSHSFLKTTELKDLFKNVSFLTKNFTSIEQLPNREINSMKWFRITFAMFTAGQIHNITPVLFISPFLFAIVYR